MNIEQFIASKQAATKKFAVVTTYADGQTRQMQTATVGQAENYAHGQRAKIGRDLINRDTGETVRVVGVTVSAI